MLCSWSEGSVGASGHRNSSPEHLLWRSSESKILPASWSLEQQEEKYEDVRQDLCKRYEATGDVEGVEVHRNRPEAVAELRAPAGKSDGLGARMEGESWEKWRRRGGVFIGQREEGDRRT